MTSMVEYLPISMDTNPATPATANAAPAIDVWILVLPRFALLDATGPAQVFLSLIHISEPTRQAESRMPSSA